MPGELKLEDAAWELWNIRALWPEADLEMLAQIKRRMDRFLAREREALAGLWAGDQDILAPGHSFLEAHPELATGVTVSLHMGPYQLLVEPLLAAGLDPVILLNDSALKSHGQPMDEFMRHLGHRKQVQWIAVGKKPFIRDLLGAVRDQRPVLVYLDGNNGTGGMAQTRQQGITYQLPGRQIKVRTGLARLVCRLGCPVHPVVLSWNDEGGVSWHKEPTQTWSRQHDPEAVTRLLFDWAFREIMAQPWQWNFWDMLKESAACFDEGELEMAAVPEGLRDDFQRSYEICLERSPQTVKLILEHETEVWPGDVLADLSEDRFYPAAGLQDRDLELLREDRPTLARLCELHGQAWVQFHGLRLCLLGLARLGG